MKGSGLAVPVSTGLSLPLLDIYFCLALSLRSSQDEKNRILFSSYPLSAIPILSGELAESA